MDSIEIVKRVEMAFGVRDARTDEDHNIIVTFYDDQNTSDMEDVTSYLESVGYEMDDRISKTKIQFKST